MRKFIAAVFVVALHGLRRARAEPAGADAAHRLGGRQPPALRADVRQHEGQAAAPAPRHEHAHHHRRLGLLRPAAVRRFPLALPRPVGLRLLAGRDQPVRRERRVASRCSASTSRRAFFLSIEFQGTGYLVYSLQGGLRRPAGQARPRPPRELHARARARSPNGVVVGSAQLGGAARTPTSRRLHATPSSQRGDFQAAYPRLDDGGAVRRQALPNAGVTPDGGRARRGRRGLRHGHATTRAAALRNGGRER